MPLRRFVGHGAGTSEMFDGVDDGDQHFCGCR